MKSLHPLGWTSFPTTWLHQPRGWAHRILDGCVVLNRHRSRQPVLFVRLISRTRNLVVEIVRQILFSFHIFSLGALHATLCAWCSSSRNMNPMHFCLSVTVSVFLPVCMCFCLCVCLSLGLDVFLSACLAACVCICFCVCLCPSACLSVYLSACLSVKIRTGQQMKLMRGAQW